MTRLSNFFLKGIVAAALAICLFPLIAVALAAMAVPGDAILGLIDTVLPRYLMNTAGLVVVTCGLAALIGLSTAWLVTMAEFPGRRLLEVSLVLPSRSPPT